MDHVARFNLRMQKELKLLLTDPPPGVTVPPPSEEENSSTSCLSSIEARIEGPEETVYSGGFFTARVQIPERYPFQPPIVTFATPIYHPNIDNGGRICLDILNLPPKGAWQPSLNISTVLTSIRLLLSEPNPDDGLMCEVSKEYKYDRQVFDQKARSWTEKYAKAGAFGSNDAGLIGASSKTEAEQAHTGSVAQGSNISEGNRKKIYITRDKLSLRAAVGKSNVDDKENGVVISPSLLPQSKYIKMSSNKIDLPKQTPPSAAEQPVKVLSSKDSHQSKEHPPQPVKAVETLIALDSEDSAGEDDMRPLKSRLSLVRSRGWKAKQQRR